MMSDDVAGVCADLESIATRFENEEDRINTDDLMAAIDHTDTLLEALDSQADAAGITPIHPAGFETFAALELGRAAIDWASLLRGIAELFEEFTAEAAEPWMYQLIWLSLAQFTATVRAFTTRRFGTTRPTTQAATHAVDLRRLLAATQLELQFRTAIETALGEFLYSLESGGRPIPVAYWLITQLYQFEAAIWVEFDALGMTDDCEDRAAVARQRRQFAHTLRAYEAQLCPASSVETPTADRRAVIARLHSVLEALAELE
jgi:hypothetical protein